MTEITRQLMLEAIDQQIDSFEEMEAVSEQDEISYYSAKVILWKAIRAALTEQQAQALPEGWVVVPTIPTKEMLDAAWADAIAEDAHGVWNSMIQAAIEAAQREGV